MATVESSSPIPHQQEPPTALPLSLPLPLPPPPSVPPTTTPSTNPRRLPPPCWSHDETVALIDSYRDKWYSLRRGNLKATHWQEVADAVGLRCPTATPPKTAVQCRHKMEKLRKRYRTEIQRARSMPLTRFSSSSWVHFKKMDAMEKGPSVKPDYMSDSAGEDNENEDEDDDEYDQDYGYNNNGSVNTRSVHKLYRNNGIGSSNNSGGGGGFRIRIPTGVSIAQPGPKMYPKYSGTNPNFVNSNPNLKPNYGANLGSGGYGGSRVLRGSDEAGRSGSGPGMGKRERERDREREPMAEMVSAIKMLGDGFVRMEQMKMEMAREIETMRMEMEMKRTEMILESQHRIVEAFAKAVSEKKNKKAKRMPSPES